MLNEMFGKIGSGMCRLSMNGNIAVKTSNGYKSYNVKENKLTNCDNFVFDIGEEFFFLVPTNKVDIGDIILVNGKPKCVIKNEDKTITVINYEDSIIETILPERHIFMGNTYFYGKIVSMFGNGNFNSTDGMNKMLSYMMMSEMMKGNGTGGNNMNSMLPWLMMGNNSFSSMFDGLFETSNDNANDNNEDKENA